MPKKESKGKSKIKDKKKKKKPKVPQFFFPTFRAAIKARTTIPKNR